MHWLSQMIHTQIDLRKQYPAESCRSKSNSNDPPITSPKGKATRAAILEALGDDRLTTVQLFKRIPAYRDSHSLGRMLRTMEQDGQVIGHGEYNVVWRRK